MRDEVSGSTSKATDVGRGDAAIHTLSGRFLSKKSLPVFYPYKL